MGSPSNRAAREAQAAEDARMRAIAGTQAKVNEVFNSPQRAAEIQQLVNAVREFKLTDLNDQKQVADRQLAFALARKGQVGGSTQIDRQKQLGKDYNRGVLDVDRQAAGVGASVSAADQDARARLISLANSGLDATTGARQAGEALRSNLESTRSTALAEGAGNFFGSAVDFARRAREESDRRRGLEASGFGLYNTGAGYGG